MSSAVTHLQLFFLFPPSPTTPSSPPPSLTGHFLFGMWEESESQYCLCSEEGSESCCRSMTLHCVDVKGFGFFASRKGQTSFSLTHTSCLCVTFRKKKIPLSESPTHTSYPGVSQMTKRYRTLYDNSPLVLQRKTENSVLYSGHLLHFFLCCVISHTAQ